MAVFRVKEGMACAGHTETYHQAMRGDPIESDRDLAHAFPEKFEVWPADVPLPDDFVKAQTVRAKAAKAQAAKAAPKVDDVKADEPAALPTPHPSGATDAPKQPTRR